MEEQTNIKTIAIKDLWDIFVKRVWIMILAAAIAVGGFIAFDKLTYKPEYSSKATLYILSTGKEDGDSSISDVTSSINLATKIVNDCTHFLKSHTVLDDVISDLHLNMNYKQLSEKISTNNPTDTRFLEVTVRADSPEEAKAIVDLVCEIGKDQINNTMNIQQVNLYEHGIYNANPVNETSLTTYILVGLVAAVLVYGIFFIMFMLDDSVWTDEEIDKYLGLSVLGDIPDANSTHKKGYGYGKYGKYGKYGGKYGAYSAYAAYGYNTQAAAEKTEKEKSSAPADKNKGAKK